MSTSANVVAVVFGSLVGAIGARWLGFEAPFALVCLWGCLSGAVVVSQQGRLRGRLALRRVRAGGPLPGTRRVRASGLRNG